MKVKDLELEEKVSNLINQFQSVFPSEHFGIALRLTRKSLFKQVLEGCLYPCPDGDSSLYHPQFGDDPRGTFRFLKEYEKLLPLKKMDVAGNVLLASKMPENMVEITLFPDSKPEGLALSFERIEKDQIISEE